MLTLNATVVLEYDVIAECLLSCFKIYLLFTILVEKIKSAGKTQYTGYIVVYYLVNAIVFNNSG